MNTNTHEGAARVAQALIRARRERRPESAAGLDGSLRDADDAYEVHRLVAEALPDLRAGTPPAWKSGGGSRTAPLTHAALPASGVWRSPADASRHPFHQRFIEAEVALRLARDISPADAAALTHETAANCIEAMTVSIEIVDMRWAETVDAPALLKLADFQSHGALVLGEWVPYAARDWSKQVCEVTIADQRKEFKGTHSLGEPAWLLPLWLRHATRDGSTMPKGAVVTTGTWCGLLTAAAGDDVHVSFPGIGEARVKL